MVAVARDALLEWADREGWVAPQVQIETPQAATQTSCPQGWDIVVRDLRSLSRLRLSARCADQPSRSFVLRAVLSAEVLVATRQLSSGRALGADDVELQRRDLAQASDALARLEDLQGQALRSSLRPGQIVQKRQLQPAVLIQRGERVRIVARHEGVEVQAGGEALEPGALGERIRVRNSASGRVIAARVLEAGVVEPAQ